MKPINNFVSPVLTDLYQITMAYGYWKSGRHNEQAVFDLFFRKNPFGGEFTVFAGLEEAIRSVSEFRFTEDQTKYLAEGPMQGCDSAFFDWLRNVNSSELKIFAIPEGTLVFPRVPLIRVEGPLAIAQLQETTLLNLVNFPSLIATNAARFRLAAGWDKTMIEFGLRRAQGPDGGVSASRYSCMGGFDGTSNVLAGMLFGLLVRGTHAHAYVSSFSGLHEIKNRSIKNSKGENLDDFVEAVLGWRKKLNFINTNEGELAAFITYAQAFPNRFLALVDTYNTLESGVPNFICVALALHEIGEKPIGIRLDSGDIAYLSKESRSLFQMIAQRLNLSGFADGLTIFASNDIDESVLVSLKQQGHEVNAFGIGTHLVTCKAQPALGCVYKLVEINGVPRIKLSDDVGKMTIPGRKEAYRLIGEDGHPLLDVMIEAGKQPPQADRKILCRHPFSEAKRAYVVPKVVVPLHRCVWDGKQSYQFSPLVATRAYVIEQIKSMRPDHMRPVNATPYKISVSEELYNTIHSLWMHEAPITELS